MGWFSREPKVPETISTEDWTKLRGRAQRANRHEDMFGKKAVNRRIASTEQQQKRKLS